MRTSKPFQYLGGHPDQVKPIGGFIVKEFLCVDEKNVWFANKKRAFFAVKIADVLGAEYQAGSMKSGMYGSGATVDQLVAIRFRKDGHEFCATFKARGMSPEKDAHEIVNTVNSYALSPVSVAAPSAGTGGGTRFCSGCGAPSNGGAFCSGCGQSLR